MLAHEAIHDGLVERLAGAIEVLHVGQASDPEIDVPPVIEREAQERVARYAAIAEALGDGSPRAPRDVPDARLLRDTRRWPPTCRRIRPCWQRRSSDRCSRSNA